MKSIEFKPTGYPSDLTDKQWEIIAEYFPQNGNNDYHKRSLERVDANHLIFNQSTTQRAITAPKKAAVVLE